MLSNQWKDLLGYQKSRWGQPISEKWIALCSDLREYQAPSKIFAISVDRKWEVVSALQKTIRRGDRPLALRLVSAIVDMPSESAYFWRRICVIACEDVGLADDTLTTFVVACATVFHPKATGKYTYDVLCFLTEQMCNLTTRSRIYCSCSLLESAITGAYLPELEIDDLQIVSAIAQMKALIETPESPWLLWQKINGWRTEGLLKFVRMRLPFQLKFSPVELPSFNLLSDLPSYCYDMHTRVGLAMLRRLVRGIEGALEIEEILRCNKVKNAHKTLGEALFFAEGGRISGELEYEQLRSLEQRMFAHQNGLSLHCWEHLQELLSDAGVKAAIDRMRQEILYETYAQKICN